MRVAIRIVPIATLLLIAVVAAAASASLDSSAVSLDAIASPKPGWLGVDLTAPASSTVTLSELGGAAVSTPLRTVTMTAPELRIENLVQDRCDRRTRRLEAVAVTADGTRSTADLTVSTPSCAHRFEVKVRPRTAVRVRRPLTVTVTDTWKTGGTAARVCLRVKRASSCKSGTVSGAARGTRTRPEVTRSGLGEVSVSGPGFAITKRLETRPAGAALRVLATGDSMIQIIDSFLDQRLKPHGRGRVTSDARISTGISKPFMFDWVRHAKGAAARVRPQATVMFIGANDGFPIGKASCCDADWVDAYAQRVKTMMSAYRRGGAGRVYWLTIPAPRGDERKTIYHAVNQAIERAAASFPPDEVSVIDLVPIFTPGGVYRSSIDGHVVRQADGIHLNVAGAKIAAEAILTRLRADGLTP